MVLLAKQGNSAAPVRGFLVGLPDFILSWHFRDRRTGSSQIRRSILEVALESLRSGVSFRDFHSTNRRIGRRLVEKNCVIAPPDTFILGKKIITPKIRGWSFNQRSQYLNYLSKLISWALNRVLSDIMSFRNRPYQVINKGMKEDTGHHDHHIEKVGLSFVKTISRGNQSQPVYSCIEGHVCVTLICASSAIVRPSLS